MEYTRQEEFGRFGERYGCFFTCLVNVAEKEMERKLSTIEKYAALGISQAHEYIANANYKNAKSLSNEIPGWSAMADPEWHLLIRNMHKALSTILSLFSMSLGGLTHTYAIHELQTSVGSHFVLFIDGREWVNPDPTVGGPVTKSIREIN